MVRTREFTHLGVIQAVSEGTQNDREIIATVVPVAFGMPLRRLHNWWLISSSASVVSATFAVFVETVLPSMLKRHSHSGARC